MNLNKFLYSGIVLSVLGVSSANALNSNKEITVQAKTHSNKVVKHYFYGKNVRAYGHHGVIYKNHKMTNRIGNLSQTKFKNKKFKVDGAVKVKLSNGKYVTLVKIKGYSITGFVKASDLHIYSLKNHSGKKTNSSSSSNTDSSNTSIQSSNNSQSTTSAQSNGTSATSATSAQSNGTNTQNITNAESSSANKQSSASTESSSASKQSSASAQSSSASKQSSASAQSSSASKQSSASAESSSASKQSSASAESSSASKQSSASAQSNSSNNNSSASSSSSSSNSDPKLDAARDQIFTDLNANRASVGVAPVTRNAKLDQLAQLRAQQLISDFSHYNASGQLYAQIDAPQFGLPSNFLCAENIAMNEEDDNISAAKMSNTQWWTDEKGSTPDNDGGHRKNIRDTGNTYVGIGAAYDSKTGNWYFVQDFGNSDKYSSEYID